MSMSPDRPAARSRGSVSHGSAAVAAAAAATAAAKTRSSAPVTAGSSSSPAQRVLTAQSPQSTRSTPRKEIIAEESVESLDQAAGSLAQLNVLLQMQIAAIQESFPMPPTNTSRPDLSFMGIRKLTGKLDYYQWRYLMQACFEQLDLWSVVVSPSVSSSPATPTRPSSRLRRVSVQSAASFSALHSESSYQERNALAFSCISLSVSDEIAGELRQFLTNQSSAHKAWIHLDDVYGDVTVFDRIRTDRRLYQRMQTGESMTNNIQRILSAVEFLRWAGDEIDDITVVRTLLTSLPDSYDLFIQSMTPEQLSSSHNAIIAILDHESLRSSVEQQSPPPTPSSERRPLPIPHRFRTP